MVKYLRNKTGFELEKSINIWLENNPKHQVINILYNISFEDDETWHNTFILYT